MAQRRRLTHEESPLPAVVDTCVVSFIFKRNEYGQRYESHLINRLLILSPMTVAELDRWALKRRWGAARRSALEQYIQTHYVIEPFSRALCGAWAEVTQQAEWAGRSISCADAWIAAVAVFRGIPLITNNPAHYAGVPNLMIITGS